MLNSILLLILFIFDTYRRRSRSQLVKYILLAVDAVSSSMVLHTIGLMQSTPIRNNLFEIWSILLVALRFSINYITIYGLQEEGQVQWNTELGAAVSSITWTGVLNGTRGSYFKTPLWVLWALQPLRVGYMLLAYQRARKSYWQGLSSGLLADYMETENGLKDPEPSSNKNESWNNSKSKPKCTSTDDCWGVGPSSDSRVSNQWGRPPYTVEEAKSETTDMVLRADTEKVNLRSNAQIEPEIEEVSQKNGYEEPRNCDPNAEPQQSIGEANLQTNTEEPSSSAAYDPSTMRGYRYLIQGETWQEVEAKNLEDKLQLKITDEEKLITLDKIWQCKGKLLSEWGDQDGQLKDLCLSFTLYRLLRCRFDDYPLPDISIPKTRMLLLDGILSRTTNGESAKAGNKGPEDLQAGTREGNEITKEQQGGAKEGNKGPEKQGSDNDQHGVAEELDREEIQPNTRTDGQSGKTGEPDRETKLLRRATEKKKWSAKEQDGIAQVQEKGEKQLDARAHSQNRSTEEHDIYGCDTENDQDKVKGEIADRAFEITGTELSFLNDYLYSRFPVIFWRERGGLITSIFLYIIVVATTCWVGISVVHVYTPSEGDFAHVIHGYNVDMLITWGMLLLILLKETWEILIYLFSDWTKVMLVSMYVECACMRNWLMENFIWLLCKYSMVGRWHGKIDQYNFLKAYNYKPSVRKLAILFEPWFVA